MKDQYIQNIFIHHIIFVQTILLELIYTSFQLLELTIYLSEVAKSPIN